MGSNPLETIELEQGIQDPAVVSYAGDINQFFDCCANAGTLSLSVNPICISSITVEGWTVRKSAKW